MAISVLYLVPDLLGPPSGIARYGRLVTAALAGFAAPLNLVSLADAAQTDAAQADAAALPLSGYYPCAGQKLRFVRQAARLALQERPALLLNGHPHFAALSWLLAQLVGARLVSFIYGIDAWEPLAPLRRAGLRRSAQIIAISHYTARRAQQANGLPAARMRVLHNCLDPEFTPAPLPSSQVGLRLLTVARLSLREQYKGHDVVIRALPALRQQFPGLVYDVVGDGDGRAALEELARQQQVQDVVRFHGFVSAAELRQRYREAAVFVMPSRAEGFGFVFLEAMNYGLPVVGGNVDATVEVVADGQTGYLVDPQDVTAVGARIAALLADPALRRQMGLAGQQRVQEKFGVPQFRHKLHHYLAEVINNGA